MYTHLNLLTLVVNDKDKILAHLNAKGPFISSHALNNILMVDQKTHFKVNGDKVSNFFWLLHSNVSEF